MTVFDNDYIEVSQQEQFQRLSSLYLDFCVFIYSDDIPWSYKIINENSLSKLMADKYTKMLTINLNKYPHFKDILDINIFPIFLIYHNQTIVSQVSPLFENLIDILDRLL